MIDKFCNMHICTVFQCSIKPVWLGWWRVVWECAADIKWASIISAQIVLIVHGSFNSVHSQTTSLSDCLEPMVFANVWLLKNLQLSCLNVTYMIRSRYPAEDGGVWLRSGLATKTVEHCQEQCVDRFGTSPKIRVSLCTPAARQSLQITTWFVLKIKWPTLRVRTVYNTWRCPSIQIWT